LPGSVFLSSKDSSKKRNSVINDMRKGNLQNLIATSLADEGLDIKPLDAVHMVGSGSSPSRIPQRIGRVLRLSPDTNKQYGIGIYYHHILKSLYEQGRDAKQILSREPEFNIYDIKGHHDLRTNLAQLVSAETPLFGSDGSWNL
jgi:superfamily II DNA or RNA helicase